jgi:hypothetical protein
MAVKKEKPSVALISSQETTAERKKRGLSEKTNGSRFRNEKKNPSERARGEERNGAERLVVYYLLNDPRNFPERENG